MKAETDPITEDEWLLRRVNSQKFNASKIPIISPNAFEPRIEGRDPDTTGISLYREACLADPIQILDTIDTPEKRDATGIVRIPVACLKDLGLTVQIEIVPGIPGHVVIPEFNSIAYSQAKGSYTTKKLGLAKKASEEGNVVRLPVKLPDNTATS